MKTFPVMGLTASRVYKPKEAIYTLYDLHVQSNGFGEQADHGQMWAWQTHCHRPVIVYLYM